MDKLISALLDWLNIIATSISLEVFVLLGAFLEEIVAPIPSPFVMTQAAVLAKVQEYSLFQLMILVLLASAAKTFSSYLLYFFTDKAEDLVLGKFGKYFGVSHAQVEKLGAFLSQSWWDDVLLFLSRALPFVPTSLVTVAAGAIKYNVRSFLLMTFCGSLVRNTFYLWVGYFGWTYFNHLLDEFLHSPVVVAVVIGAVVLLVFGVLKAKNSLWDRLMNARTSAAHPRPVPKSRS